MNNEIDIIEVTTGEDGKYIDIEVPIIKNNNKIDFEKTCENCPAIKIDKKACHGCSLWEYQEGEWV